MDRQTSFAYNKALHQRKTHKLCGFAPDSLAKLRLALVTRDDDCRDLPTPPARRGALVPAWARLIAVAGELYADRRVVRGRHTCPNASCVARPRGAAAVPLARSFCGGARQRRGALNEQRGRATLGGCRSASARCTQR